MRISLITTILHGATRSWWKLETQIKLFLTSLSWKGEDNKDNLIIMSCCMTYLWPYRLDLTVAAASHDGGNIHHRYSAIRVNMFSQQTPINHLQAARTGEGFRMSAVQIWKTYWFFLQFSGFDLDMVLQYGDFWWRGGGANVPSERFLCQVPW